MMDRKSVSVLTHLRRSVLSRRRRVCGRHHGVSGNPKPLLCSHDAGCTGSAYPRGRSGGLSTARNLSGRYVHTAAHLAKTSHGIGRA